MQKRFEQPVSEFKERVVSINRVAKTVKGGRNMRFAALVVVGDENGRVGVGTGKAVEVPEAVRKAVEDAKRHVVTIPIVGTTIPHAVEGTYGKGHVRMLPAQEGRYGRYRRRTGACGARNGGHKGYSHEELRLEQSGQLRKSGDRRTSPASHGRADRTSARQDG